MLTTEIELCEPIDLFQFTTSDGVKVRVEICCELVVDKRLKVFFQQTNN